MNSILEVFHNMDNVREAFMNVQEVSTDVDNVRELFRSANNVEELFWIHSQFLDVVSTRMHALLDLLDVNNVNKSVRELFSIVDNVLEFFPNTDIVPELFRNMDLKVCVREDSLDVVPNFPGFPEQESSNS